VRNPEASYSIVLKNVREIPRERARHLRAVFDVELEGVGTICECRLLVSGGRRKVVGPSINDSIRGWLNVVKLNESLALRILGECDKHGLGAPEEIHA